MEFPLSFRGRKRSLYEGGVRLPFIARLPGRIPAGRVDADSVITAVDFLPSVCALAGAKPPANWRLDGEDIGDIWSGKSRPRRQPIYWEWRFNIAGHLLTASVMNAPAGLILSKIILPESGEPETRNTLQITVEKTEANVIDAAASGAGTGLQLALNVGAMLMAFIGLVALLNFLIGWGGGLVGFPQLSLQWLLGKILWLPAVLMGVPLADADTVGAFIGIKVVLNEFVAYGSGRPGNPYPVSCTLEPETLPAGSPVGRGGRRDARFSSSRALSRRRALRPAPLRPPACCTARRRPPRR